MAATPSLHQLFFLADHLKLSLLERQRALALNLEPNKHDAHIARSLSDLHDGLEQLDAAPDAAAAAAADHRARLRTQYNELYAQFHGQAPPAADLTRPNDPALAGDFAAARTRPPAAVGAAAARRSKNVRFRDNPDEEDEDGRHRRRQSQADQDADAEDTANRAALFASSQEPYRDDPAAADGPDQSHLDNQQIHAYHTQVLRDQDEQLDVLGQSVGRQRMLGIEMGSELEEQNELLDDVESGVDRHGTTLERARHRLGHVARKSRDNWSWVTIGILICILVLLIVVLK